MKKIVVQAKTNVKLAKGFTLIELMIVILILAALIALLLPAINSTRRNVRISQVRTEISAIEQGISLFRATYGVNPPSFIVLSETAAGWTGPAMNEHKATIRRIWPSFDFTLARDINQDGDATDTLVLTGAECLTFFLGGIIDSSVPSGFSVNPANPFAPMSAAPSATRHGPFVDIFDPSRLVDLDADGMSECLDPLPGQTAPYIYTESRDGRGYRTNPAGENYDLFVYTQQFGLVDINGDGVGDVIQPTSPTNSDMRSVYLYPGGSRAYQKESHQIISPGFDGEYGIGGEWQSEYSFSAARDAERDNITNFHGGTLE